MHARASGLWVQNNSSEEATVADDVRSFRQAYPLRVR